MDYFMLSSLTRPYLAIDFAFASSEANYFKENFSVIDLNFESETNIGDISGFCTFLDAFVIIYR